MCEEHEALLDSLFLRQDGSPVLHFTGSLRIDKPKISLCGVYKPDAVIYCGRPEKIQLFIELELSEVASKDIVGACILADHISKRQPSATDVAIIFVYDDEFNQTKRGHLEERLQVAQGYTDLQIREAMSVSQFRNWFPGWAIETGTISLDDFQGKPRGL